MATIETTNATKKSLSPVKDGFNAILELIDLALDHEVIDLASAKAHREFIEDRLAKNAKKSGSKSKVDEEFVMLVFNHLPFFTETPKNATEVAFHMSTAENIVSADKVRPALTRLLDQGMAISKKPEKGAKGGMLWTKSADHVK